MKIYSSFQNIFARNVILIKYKTTVTQNIVNIVNIIIKIVD
jgi:hypothetical protein